MSGFSSVENYRIARRVLADSVARQRGFESYDALNGETKREVAFEAVRQFRQVRREGQESWKREQENSPEYGISPEFKINENGKIEYTTGAFAGVLLTDLDDRTRLLTPWQYKEEDAVSNRIAENAFNNKASQVVIAFGYEGNNNRDLIVMTYDAKTNRGTTRIVNSTVGNSFAKLTEIAKQKFNNLNEIKPTDGIYILSDVQLSQEAVQKSFQKSDVSMAQIREREIARLKNSNIKENKEIQAMKLIEEKMRIDKETDKVFLKDKDGKEVDIESFASSVEERKQKHRLVVKIQSAHSCATEDEKPVAFFYAPKNLGEEKKEQTISQIIVDPKGNVTFKTINLSEDLTRPERQHLLTKLGYKKEKTPPAFSYVDDPLTDEQMKNIVKTEMDYLKSGRSVEFLSLRVFSVENRFDFLRLGLNTDRVISNNPILYFHDIALSRNHGRDRDIDESVEADGKVDGQTLLRRRHATDAIFALVAFTDGEKMEIAEKKVSDPENPPEKPDGKDTSRRSIQIVNQPMNLERQTRKKVKKLNDGTSDDNDNGGGGNTLTNNIFVVGELHPPASASPHLLAGLETQVLQAGGVRADATSLRDQQKEGNTFPKGPTSQNSTKMYLEEETGNDIFFEDFAESLLTVFPEGVDRVSSWEEIPMMNEELSENHEVIELKREMAIKHLDRTFHYHDLNHDSEQTQKIADDTKTQNVAHDINLPIIRSQFPIGQRVDIEKRYQESIAQICGMFLSLYFGIVHKSGDVEMTKKTFAFQVAEEEKLIPGNNFQQLVLEDTRIFAILLIAAVRLSEEISMKKSLR